MASNSENQRDVSNDSFTDIEDTKPSMDGSYSNPAFIDQQDTADSIASTPVSFQTAAGTQSAVQLQNVQLSYGFGKRATKILQDISLDIPEGVIYGLLGPSGCGKTTLLKCIVGRLNPNVGSVLVFGSKPGSKGSCVPGRGIGYMPQELALYAEFTIKETLAYFGRLQRISTDVIKERTAFLLDFLDLADKSHLIRSLSGGQQRRVSLAAALIHQPPLLILDEPTVGVDPLLRESIWKHLVTLTSQENMTVIITTHYIEEASQANIVGLMRKGRMLAEDSPDALMEKSNQPSLEDVFLTLCRQAEVDENTLGLDGHVTASQVPAELLRKESNTKEVQTEVDRTVQQSSNFMSTSTVNLIRDSVSNLTNGREIENLKNSNPHAAASSFKNRCGDSLSNTSELFKKNFRRLRREKIYALFALIFPVIQMALLLTCIGRDPADVSLAIVNEENPSLFSKIFLEKLDKNLIQKPFDNLTLAKNSVEEGSNWGAVHIGDSFSRNLLKRYRAGLEADIATIDASTIRVYLDMSNQQIGYLIQKALLESFQSMGIELLKSSGASTAVGNLPVSIEQPIYGPRHPNFTAFVAPGFILSIAFYMASSMSSLLLMEDKQSGLVDRTWVSGVTNLQIYLGHAFSSTVVVVIQVLLLMIFSFAIFDLPIRGTITLISILTLLQSLCGLSYGFFISAISGEERTSILLSQGSVVVFLVISGVIWPIEAMPSILRYICYCLPQTIAVQSARCIFERGWDLTNKAVWSGFLVTIGWTIFCFIISALIFSRKK